MGSVPGRCVDGRCASQHAPAGVATALHERHPRFRGRCFVVAPQVSVTQPEATASGIGTLPLDLFLHVVGAQAEAALAAGLGPVQ